MPNSKNFFKEIFQHIIPVRSQFHVLINLNWFLHSASNFDRSANLRALRARTLNVFRTLCAVVSLVSRAVRAHVPPVLLVLRALVLPVSVSCMPLCLTYLVFCLPSSITCPSCLIPGMFHVPVSTFVLLCFHFSRNFFFGTRELF